MTVAEVVIGLIVNPIAGIGGAAGLAGSDGQGVQHDAALRGGRSHAADRAVEVLRAIRVHLESGAALLLVAPGDMGAATARAAGVPHQVLDLTVGEPTSAADTRSCAAALAETAVDLLLFAGGDGTATDVAAGCGETVTALGIPSGVKMYSGCFATDARAAACVADRVASGRATATTLAEVVDLDEAALRGGRVAPRLTAALRVPVSPVVQPRKAPSAANAAGEVAALAAAAAHLVSDGVPTALGPGGTTAAVSRALGLEPTLLGVDIVCDGEIRASGVSEPELYDWAERGPLRIVVSVIGGQGFVLGRGNQQVSPRVIRACGPANIVILAAESKLIALGGRPLLVDTGDAALDEELSGYRRVLTGPRQWTICRIGQSFSTQVDHHDRRSA